jgi:hypothetical protein
MKELGIWAANSSAFFNGIGIPSAPGDKLQAPHQGFKQVSALNAEGFRQVKQLLFYILWLLQRRRGLFRVSAGGCQ